MLKIDELANHLARNKERLVGSWIKSNSSYDGAICDVLNMEEDTVRYWDARWNGVHIEFKKGHSIWLDLVRYSETLLKSNKEASIKTMTLFFIPDRDRTRIQEVIGVATKDIINQLGLTTKQARELIALNQTVPRSLNAQASLTKKDLKGIATFVV